MGFFMNFMNALMLWCLLLGSPDLHAQWQAVTEEAPPYNYLENSKITGASTEIIQELLKRAELKAKFHLWPWNRSLRQAETKKNTFVYSTARTPSREQKFKWVGPLITDKWLVHTLESSPIQYTDDLEKLKKYKVAGLIGEADTEYMRDLGFDVEFVNDIELNIKKLKSGRVILFPSTAAFAKLIGEKYDLKFKPVAELKQAELYAAFNLNTPIKTINKLNEILAEMRKDGTTKRILKKYNLEI